MTDKEFKELKAGDKLQVKGYGQRGTFITRLWDESDKKPKGYYTYRKITFDGKKAQFGEEEKKYEPNSIFIGSCLYPASRIKVIKEEKQ